MAEGEIEVQAKQALANLKAVVEASGSSIDKIVKTTVCEEISLRRLIKLTNYG